MILLVVVFILILLFTHHLSTILNTEFYPTLRTSFWFGIGIGIAYRLAICQEIWILQWQTQSQYCHVVRFRRWCPGHVPGKQVFDFSGRVYGHGLAVRLEDLQDNFRSEA